MTSACRQVAAVKRDRDRVANGPALAAFLAAGIGAFAMGAFASANEAGLFVAPALYGPAGGVSGRTTFAAVVWLVSWGVLHGRWKDRRVRSQPVYIVTLALVGLGILGALPLIWGD